MALSVSGGDTFNIQIASKTPDYTKVSKSTMNFIAAGGVVKPTHLKTVGDKFQFANNDASKFGDLINLESTTSDDSNSNAILQRLIDIGKDE